MNEIFEEVKNMSKSFLQTSGTFFKKISIPLLIVCICGLLLVACYYVITIEDGSYREGKKSNTPYVVEQHTNNVYIDTSGNITTSITAQELWDQMLEDGSRVDEYLDKPEELNKLINAQLVTDYLDTRENPDAAINWDNLNKDVNSGKVQGIVKLKRADKDGNISTMTYVDPETFEMYIDNYNASGSESDRQIALSHFTLEKGYQASNGGGNYKRGTDGDAKKIEGNEIREVITIPQNQNYGIRYTFNSWQRVNAVPSKQMELKEKAGVTFDEDDFGRINGRYAVAVRPKFGEVGDYIDYYYIDTNGNEKVIYCIICDVKGSDADSEWGHHGGEDILEFYVNEITWTTPEWEYGDLGQASSAHPNPAEGGFYMKWKGNATKVVRGGNYFTDPNFVENKNSSNSTSESNRDEQDENNEGNESDSNSEATIGDGLMCWPATSTTITSPFGNRAQPTEGASTNHKGIDIAGMSSGSDIYATEAGKVIGAGEAGSAGIMVTLDHGNGYLSKYMHNSSISVSVGQEVAKGEVIAKAGSTGVSTGTHLHFQIEQNGVPVDPMSFKYENGMGNGTGGIGSNSAGASTLTSAAYYAKVATWSQRTEIITSDDPSVETTDADGETTFSMTTTKIDYQQFVDGVRMPFDYLWALLVVSQDKDFVFELADLVYDSQIEITVHDNWSKNTSITVDTYEIETKVITDDINVSVSYQEKPQTTTGTNTGTNTNTNTNTGTNTGTNTSATTQPVTHTTTEQNEEPYEDIEAKPYTTTTTIITINNTLNIALTKANVWIADYTQEFTYQPPESTGLIPSPERTEEDEEFPEEPDETNSEDAMGLAEKFRQEVHNKYLQNYTNVITQVTSLKSDYYYRTINRKINISSESQASKYISSPAKTEEKTDKEADEPNFVKIFVKKRKAKNNILSAVGILVEILENSEDTIDMVDLTKYLLYKATGRSYGVTEYTIKIIDLSKANKVKGSAIENYIKAWENAGLWLYETGQSSTFPTKYLSADGKNYIVYEDGAGSGSKGHNNVAYGIATFIEDSENVDEVHPVYGSGYYNWKTEYAAFGIDVTTFQEGSLVDKQVTMSIYGDLIQGFQNSVIRGLETNLPEYEFSQTQIDSLTAVCYQYGNINSFYNAYISSLNSDGSINAQKLSQNYRPFTYTKTIGSRSYANLLLFTEGKYTDMSGNEIAVGSSLSNWDGETYSNNNYTFPVYNQGDSRWGGNSFGGPGGKTIKSSGCSAAALAMIISGYTGEAITPDILVQKLDEIYPAGNYYDYGVGGNARVYSNEVLQSYGLSKKDTSSRTEAMEALKSGYAVLGYEQGHYLAFVPVSSEDAAQGYVFRILDSYRGHNVLCRDFTDADRVVQPSSGVVAIIYPN